MAIDNYIPKVGDTNRIDNTPAKTMRGAIAGLMEESGFIRIASGYFRLSGIVQLEEDFRRFFESRVSTHLKECGFAAMFL